MKQFVFLCLLTVGGAVGGLVHPFWAVLLYYTLAVLRPQYLWDWALPMEVRWSLIAAVVALIAVVLHARRVADHNRLNLTAALTLVYALLVMVSVVTAYDPGVAQAWAVDFAKVLLIAAVAMLVISRLWQVRAVALMVGLCVGYIAYEINYNYFVHDGRLDVFHYGFGGLDNNGAGLMLAMGLPFAYCFAWSRNLKVRAASIVVGLLMLHAVMLTYSRGAMLAGVAGLVWLAWRHRPHWQALAAAPAVLVVVLALAGTEIRDEFLSMRQYQQDRSAMARLDSWSAAWNIAWEHPVLGAGVRNSNTYSHNYGADRTQRTIHNQYLQVAADSGIPAAVIYLALVASALWRLEVAGRTLAQRGNDQPDQYRQHHRDTQADDPHADRQLLDASRLCLAVQTAIVTFAVGGVFLSLETFELSWLLVVLAAVLPGIVHRHVAQTHEHTTPDAEPDPHRPRFTFAPPVPRHAPLEPSP